jgi:DNA-binding NarL/FixJ family response regulator
MSSCEGKGRIRVLLADDHSLVRAGLKRVLEEAGDMTVVGEAGDGQEAIQQFIRQRPDIVLMDISMSGMDGLEAIKQLIYLDPEARILVLTMYPEEQYAIRALKAGCLGYITKFTSTQLLRDAVRTVAKGHQFLTDEGKNTITLQVLSNRAQSTSVESLSDRELQVVKLLAQGLKLKEVAGELSLSVRTIETYRLRALRKLHLRNDADISRFAFQNRLL